MIKAFKILVFAFFALLSTQSSGQQQLFLNQTGGAPPTAGLLDQYKGAAFAVAPDVLLYSTYSATDDIAGSLTNGQPGQWSVAILRDFDDAIKSFTPAEVANGTANTWVQELGPSDGFVRRAYDQSVTALDVSNLNHADQTDPTKMPKLFDSSTGLILENGKAAMEFDGNDDFLESSISGFNTITNLSSFLVVTPENAAIADNPGFTGWSFGGVGDKALTFNSATGLVSGETLLWLIELGASVFGRLGSTTYSRAANTQSLFSNFNLSTGTSTYAQETEVTFDLSAYNATETTPSAPEDIGWTTNDLVQIGAARRDNGVVFLQSQIKVQVLVFYPSDKSGNRTGIEDKINQVYNIY